MILHFCKWSSRINNNMGSCICLPMIWLSTPLVRTLMISFKHYNLFSTKSTHGVCQTLIAHELKSNKGIHSETLLAPCLVWDMEKVQLNTRNHVNALVWLLTIGFHGKSTLRTLVTLSARKFQSWNRSSCYQSLSSKKFITQQFFQVSYMVL